MNDPSTPGVLLKSEDGSHYFIPYSDLSEYAAERAEEVTTEVGADAPRVDAFSVNRAGGAEYSPTPVAFPPFPEN